MELDGGALAASDAQRGQAPLFVGSSHLMNQVHLSV